MKRPFVYLTIPMLLGVILYYYVEVNMHLILSLLSLSLIIFLIKLKFNISTKVNLLVSFLLLGILLANFKANNSQLIKYTNVPVELTGVVKDIKMDSEGEGRYLFLVNNIYNDEVDKKVSEKIILKIIGERKLDYGEEISFNGVLKEPLTNTNPMLFNYRLSLLSESIYTTATIKDYSITKVEKIKLNPLLNFKIKFIEKVEKTFDYHLTENNSSLIKSIILGNYYIDEDTIVKYRELGLAHILAVSGLHIGIISGILMIIFAYLGVDRRVNTILIMIIIWFYAYIIGNPPSVLRANIMFSLLLLSNIWAEPYDSINTLFLALFILIIINPFWVFNVGFQLSFVATFFIIYLTPKLKIRFYSYDSSVVKSFVGILSVQIGLLPIQAYYFNNIPIISIVSNLVLVPIFSISLILSMLLIPLSFINGLFTQAMGSLVNFLLNIQFYAIEIFNHFPYLTLRLASPSAVGIISYYLMVSIIFGIINIKKLDKKLSKTIVFYLLLLIVINYFAFTMDQRLSIDFIDVGQGDSILLRTKEGYYLIDTGGNVFGNFDIGKSIIYPFLEKTGVFKLKGVFITHFDADHCKSLPYLMDNIKIENIYIGYERADNSLYEEIKGKALSKDIPVTILKRGDRLSLDSNTNIVVIGPNEELLNNTKNSENDLSLVLLLNYFNRNILFTGDIEEAGEQNVIDSLNSRVDFLKVPHHGSNTSSNLELLHKIEPKIGFISVGRNNSFGHPHKEVIKRYEDNHIELYRTDQLGLINLTMKREDYIITPFLKEKLSVIYIIEHYGLVISYLMIYYIISYIMIKHFALLDKEMETIEL